MKWNYWFAGSGMLRLLVAVVFISVFGSIAIAQEQRPLTVTGAVGTVDEDSLGIFQFKNFAVLHKPGATGFVHVRYNLTAVEGVTRFCPATTSSIKVRFRNSDNSGSIARVTFEIHSSSVVAGGNNIIYTFTSDGRAGGGIFFTFSDPAVPISFDFGNNVYWIEATIFRSDASQFADLGTIQIFENAGSACP